MPSNQVPTVLSEERKRRKEELRRLVWGRDYKRLPFPVKLHMLLSYNGAFASNLWWTNDGKAFAVDREGFKKHIMSVFFDEHKFRSFQTILYKYQYHHVTSIYMVDDYVADILIYQHELFQEDKIELCWQITRSASRRNSLKQDMLQATNQAPAALPCALTPPPTTTIDSGSTLRCVSSDEGMQAANSASQDEPARPPPTANDRTMPRRVSIEEPVQAAIPAPKDEWLQLFDGLAEVDDFNDYEMSDSDIRLAGG